MKRFVTSAGICITKQIVFLNWGLLLAHFLVPSGVYIRPLFLFLRYFVSLFCKKKLGTLIYWCIKLWWNHCNKECFGCGFWRYFHVLWAIFFKTIFVKMNVFLGQWNWRSFLYFSSQFLWDKNFFWYVKMKAFKISLPPQQQFTYSSWNNKNRKKNYRSEQFGSC